MLIWVWTKIWGWWLDDDEEVIEVISFKTARVKKCGRAYRISPMVLESIRGWWRAR